MLLTVNEKEFMFEQRYRPSSIKECILPDSDKKVFLALAKEGKLPHLILQSNSPGTGKTTVGKALCNEINAEMLFINGSDCRIDFIRNELTNFATSRSLEGRPKVILIDEFDRQGLAEAQRHLRSFMEAYSSNCTIIMTANNLDGIIKPLQSRARIIKFGEVSSEDAKSMMKQMITRCMSICENENIEVEDKKVIAMLVKKNFPDFRKTINDLDLYSKHGKIDAGILSLITNEKDAVNEVIDALKNKNVKELRALAIKYSSDYSAFINKLVKDLYPVLSGPGIIKMYQIIGESNQFYGLAANPEIHIQYMLIQLAVELTWR